MFVKALLKLKSALSLPHSGSFFIYFVKMLSVI